MNLSSKEDDGIEHHTLVFQFERLDELQSRAPAFSPCITYKVCVKYLKRDFEQ